MGRAADVGMTCGLVGFLLVALLVPSALLLIDAPWSPAADLAASTGSIDAAGSLANGDGELALSSTVGDGGAMVPLGGTDAPDTSHDDFDEICAGEGVTSDGRILRLAGFWPTVLPFPFIIARVRKERLLEHPVRRRILDAVRGHPGIHHRQLLRLLEVSNGTLAYHLRLLERSGYLHSATAHGCKCLFIPEDHIDEQSLLLTDRDRQLLVLLSDLHAAGIKELRRRSGLNDSNVAYHLGHLRSAGFVQARHEGHALVYFRAAGSPTPSVCTTNHSPA